MQNNAKKYICEPCDFICSNKSNYVIHISTAKHGLRTQLNTNNAIVKKAGQFICPTCQKTYNVRNSLWYHMKKCNFKLTIDTTAPLLSAVEEEEGNISSEHTETEMAFFKNLVADIYKQNQALQKQMLEICKNSNNTIINNNNTLNKNKTFNLQVFLNEDCKNAMNMSEFMNSFVLKIGDLERLGKVGYVEGISDIIIKELQKLDITQRPMHCSDAKRETIYIKENDIWEKEAPGNLKVKKVISHVSRKNLQILKEWTALHPAYKNSTDPDNDEYLHLVKTALGSSADQEQTENKIVRRLIKEITIDKN